MDNFKELNSRSFLWAALGSLAVIFSFLFWLSLSGALNDGPDWLEQSLWSLVAFLFLGTVSGLAYLIGERWLILFVWPALIILPAIIFLEENLTTGLVLAAALAFMALAAWRADFEKFLRIRLLPWLVMKKGLGPLITALVLIVTLFFYAAPFVRSLEERIFVPRPLFDAIARPAADIFMRLTFSAGNGPSMTPEIKQRQEDFFNELYQSTNEQISLAGKTFKKWLPLGFSVSLFFGFKIIGTFLSWLMMPLAWLAFRILLGIKIIKIEKVATEKEIVKVV